jgi:exopolysaccharide biosynthesis polyprenyl glycosylphosphotransferase
MTKPATRTDTPPGAGDTTGEGRFGTARAEGPSSVVRDRPPLRVAGSHPLALSHDDVSRDVRARRPNLLSALIHARALERSARVISLLAIDFVALLGAILTALTVKELIRGGFTVHGVWHTALDYQAFVFLVTALLFARSGLYAQREARPGLTAIVAGLFWATFVSLLFALVKGLDFNSYYIFYGGLTFGLIWVSGLRWAYERATAIALRALGRRRRVLLVGSGKQIDAVAHALVHGNGTQYEPVGYISLTPKPDNGLRNLGSLDDLPALIGQHGIQEVIIADPDFPQDEAFDLVDRCHERGVAVRIAPTTMEIMTREHEFVPGQTVPLFELKPPVFEGADFALKRIFDLVGAVLLVLLLSPVMLVAALAIKLSSRGPVFYRSHRPGIGGKCFPCLKFRTMVAGAEQLQDRLEEHNEVGGALFKMRDDPRVTAVGRLLRRLSLDEVPNVLNVLRGEMSLVGPRPLPLRDYELLESWHRRRYNVLPGVTGLWQIAGRSDLTFDDLVRLDFYYLENWSVWLDVTILFKTPAAVFSQRGAY